MDTALLSFNKLTRQINDAGRFFEASGAVNDGEVLSVQGPSGAGKSTLLRVLARLMAAHGGEVYSQGIPWKEIPPQEWRTRVQYVSQKPVVFEGSVEDNLKLPFTLKAINQKRKYQPELAWEYMRQLQLNDKFLQQPARSLSGGEAARVVLIRALLIEPEILLLDEPTAYLDEENRGRLADLLNQWLKEPQRGIVLVSHSEQDLQAFPHHHSITIEPGVREAAI